MKSKFIAILGVFSIQILISWKETADTWISEKQKGYTIFYTEADKPEKDEYNKFISTGINSVNSFFNDHYKKDFDVYIHPGRHSLDSTWQKDWNMPTFKSECWMVASGVASRLDAISPKTWAKESCEHNYADKIKTQQLITHELVHVFHGQFNPSPDFSDATGMDWFVEGLATYASGQLDTARLKEIKNAISKNSIPNSLDKFWTGKLKYGLSGSVVMYIDKIYQRTKLKELLRYNKLTDLLGSLKLTEEELIDSWKKYITGLYL